MASVEAGENIVEDLKDEIQASGLSYKQIEEEAGLSSGTISRFIKDDRDIGLSTASKIASLFGLRLNRASKGMELRTKKVLFILSEVAKASELLQQSQVRLGTALKYGGSEIDTRRKDSGTVSPIDEQPVPRRRGRPKKEEK